LTSLLKKLLALVLVGCVLLPAGTVLAAEEPTCYLDIIMTDSRGRNTVEVTTSADLTADMLFVPTLVSTLTEDPAILASFRSPGMVRILTDGIKAFEEENAQSWEAHLTAHYSNDTGELKTLMTNKALTLGKLTQRKHYSVTFMNTVKGDRTYTTSYTITVTVYRAGHVDADPVLNGLSQLLLTEDHVAFMSGDGNGSFNATRELTRKEAAQIFYNLLRNKDVEVTTSFLDVAADSTFAPAINAMAALGILQGDGQGNFRPDDTITRAEFVTVAARMAQAVEGSHTFSDLASVAWAEKHIATGVAYGWIDGYEDGTFRPKDPINRAQAATIVCRMLQRQPDKAYINAHSDTVRGFADMDEGHWYYYTVLEAATDHSFERAASDDETWTDTKKA